MSEGIRIGAELPLERMLNSGGSDDQSFSWDEENRYWQVGKLNLTSFAPRRWRTILVGESNTNNGRLAS